VDAGTVDGQPAVIPPSTGRATPIRTDTLGRAPARFAIVERGTSGLMALNAAVAERRLSRRAGDATPLADSRYRSAPAT